jgi:hypothetical protein
MSGVGGGKSAKEMTAETRATMTRCRPSPAAPSVPGRMRAPPTRGASSRKATAASTTPT